MTSIWRTKGRIMQSILDACCGSKMFHFDKNNKDVLFVDKRKENLKLNDGRTIVINPDMICDFTNMPFKDNSFNLVIFDPPHLIKAGKKSYMRQKYGRLDADWHTQIKKGFSECWRVLKPGGTLIFKWSEVQIKLSEVLALAPAEPLIGNRGRGKTKPKSHWILFYKKVAHDEL